MTSGNGRKPISMKRAVDEALRGLEAHERRDQATEALAKRYALMIDADPTTVAKIGPYLLDCLRELGMTPKSRQSVVKGGSDDGRSEQRTKYDELRGRRQRRASAVDSSQA